MIKLRLRQAGNREAASATSDVVMRRRRVIDAKGVVTPLLPY